MDPQQRDENVPEIYKSLLEQIPAVLYIADFGERNEWIYVSPQIEKLLGYTPSEWISDSRRWLEHVHPDDRQRVLLRQRNSEQIENISSEYRMFSRDGRQIWIRDEGNIRKENSLYYGFLFDITKEKLANEKAQGIEKERIQAEDRLRGLHRFEAIGQLAAGVAHDFNNVLMAITSYCELLKLKMSDSTPEELQEIQRAAVQGTVLTRHLLAFGGKQIHAPENLNINQVLRNLEPMIVRLARQNVHIEMSLAEDLGTVEADSSQIEDLLINLTVVAREAMPEGGKLLFETANIEIDETAVMTDPSMRPGRYVQLAVTDTGRGLDEETRKHIFEPFYKKKDQTVGGGLRLPAIYGVVKQNSGYIWVYGPPEGGTAFRIYLPRIDGTVERSTPLEEAQNTPVHGHTILVVDDNDAVRMAITAYLEMSGFGVLQGSNGKEAIQVVALHDGQIDMLITDLVMPQMGGLELSQHLAIRNPDLKVLYMSGYTEETIIRQGLLDSGAFFLQKPASMQMLLKKVREMLGSGA